MILSFHLTVKDIQGRWRWSGREETGGGGLCVPSTGTLRGGYEDDKAGSTLALGDRALMTQEAKLLEGNVDSSSSLQEAEF